MQKYVSKILWLLIILDNLSKFLLINRGFLTFPDERRYLMSWSFLKHLTQGDITGSLTALFSANGRPGSVFLHTIPAGLQFLTAKIFGWELLESANSSVVFLYNLLIYILLLFLLYKIFLLFLPDKNLVLFGILLYSLLVNSWGYLRHIFPYNESLLLYFFVIYDILKTYRRAGEFTYKKTVLWGSLTFIAYLIYPAYYLSFMAVFLLFNLLGLQQKTLGQWLKFDLIYALSSLLVLSVVSFLSYIAGTSYIANVLALSATVTQGSFDESFSFLFKYFAEVEKMAGWLLILGVLGFFFYLPSMIKRRKDRFLYIFWLAFFIPYLLHTSLGFFLHKMTIYGRIIHQFMPVILLMLLYVMSRIQREKRNYVLLLLSLVLSFSYFFQLRSYLQISYPRDVYWRYLKTYPRERIVELSEYKNAWSNLPVKMEGKYIDSLKQDSIYVVNAMFFYPYDTAEKASLQLPENKHKIFDKPHFIKYKAYQYEGLNPDERKILDSLNFRIKVYN